MKVYSWWLQVQNSAMNAYAAKLNVLSQTYLSLVNIFEHKYKYICNIFFPDYP